MFLNSNSSKKELFDAAVASIERAERAEAALESEQENHRAIVNTMNRVANERDELQREIEQWRAQESPLQKIIDELTGERDELRRAIMRLPQPPREMGDGPDERVTYALNEIERQIGLRLTSNDARNAAQNRIDQLNLMNMGLTNQRDTAWQELRDIRTAINADANESTFDEVNRQFAKVANQFYAARAEVAEIITLLDPNESSGIPISQLVKAMWDEINRLRAFVTAYDEWCSTKGIFTSQFDAMLDARAALDAPAEK